MDDEKNIKSSSRMMDRYCANSNEEESFGNYSETESDEDECKYQGSCSSRIDKNNLGYLVVNKDTEDVKKSYDSFGFKEDFKKISNMGQDARLSIDIDNDYIKKSFNIMSDEKNPDLDTQKKVLGEINQNNEETDSFNFIPRYNVGDGTNFDYKSNNTNTTNQFASLGEKNESFCENAPCSIKPYNLPRSNSKQKSNNFSRKSLENYDSIVRKYDSAEVDTNPIKKDSPNNSEKHQNNEQKTYGSKGNYRKNYNENDKPVNRPKDYESIKLTKEINNQFENKMFHLIQENKSLKANKEIVDNELDFYKKIELRIGNNQSLEDFLDYALNIQSKYEHKLIVSNEKFLAQTKKYNSLQVKNEFSEKKILDLEKQKKQMSDGSMFRNYESKHAGFAAQDKDKVIKQLNEKMAMLHNEISRLKIENNNIKRTLTPRAKMALSSGANTTSNSALPNKIRSKSKINLAATNSTLGNNPINSSQISCDSTNKLDSNYSKNYLKNNNNSNMMKDKENRNIMNTPNQSLRNENHSRNFNKISVEQKSQKNLDSCFSIFDNKAQSNLKKLEDNDINLFSNVCGALPVDSVYKINQKCDDSENFNFLDVYKSKSSRSPKPTSKSKNVLQKTPKQKRQFTSCLVTQNSKECKDSGSILEDKNLETLFRKIEGLEKENFKQKNVLNSSSMQNSINKSSSISENFSELKKMNQDVDKDTLLELYNYLLMKHFATIKKLKDRDSEESKSTDAFTIKQKSCALSQNSSFVFPDS